MSMRKKVHSMLVILLLTLTFVGCEKNSAGKERRTC